MRNDLGADLLRRFVYAPSATVWNFLRDLTGRQRRQRAAADDKARVAEQRRNVARWNESHDR